MYNEAEEKFLANRDQATSITCKACLSGFYSSELQDSQGTTFICQACGSGYFQPSGASVVCDPCPAGSYQNAAQSISCNRCPVGQYQDEEGSSSCKRCPTGATTGLLGSASALDCGCEAGSINVNDNDGTLNCIPCGEGLRCPFSSSLQTLLSGQSPLGESFVPLVRSGYFATEEKPLEIFKCRPDAWCPGGRPGSCAGGLQGLPCAVCPVGQSWAGEQCTECGAANVIWVSAIAICLIAISASYFFVNDPVSAQPTPFKVAQAAVGVAASSIQILALLGLMSVRWPGTLETTSFNLQLFLLDMDRLSLSCLVGNNPTTTYALTTMTFPALILWLSFCHALSLCGCLQRHGMKRWKLPYTLNTMGLLLQVGFGTIAAVSLKPVMCFLHPNGLHSILSYPSVFCGESGHSFMMVCGSFLLTIFVIGFIVACSYAMWHLPAWSRKGEDSKVQTFRFCTSHFRFDVYWFSLLLLLRGLSFALAIAIGTNLPPLQTALASIVLVIYTITQASVRPWKAPVMNFVDTLLGALFLLLVGQSIGSNNDVETEALEYFTLFLLLFVLFCLGSLFALCAVGLALQAIQGESKDFINLGSSGDPHVISKVLKQCAESIMSVEMQILAEKISQLNPYDVRGILNLIDVISFEMQDALPTTFQTRLSTATVISKGRVAAQSFNRRLQSQVLEITGNSVSDVEGSISASSEELHAVEGSNVVKGDEEINEEMDDTSRMVTMEL